MLVDKVEITIKAGKGGDGVVSWRREKYIPKGGPDGGDGGRGGSVFFTSSDNLDTLSHYRYKSHYEAGNGDTGHSKKMAGKSGKDLELLVPTGTIITNITRAEVMADFTKPNVKILAAKGGRGGLGNTHFSTSTNQNPTQFTKGELGQARHLLLELRLIADFALIGEPNAGKSSIISALTGVDARIAAFPFSTTHPILGVMKAGKVRATLIDLPGMIEGASEGKGLGDEFLRHLQRVKGIIHVVDATGNIDDSHKVILREIEKYDPMLTKLPRILVLNKIDLLNTKEIRALKKKYSHAVLVSAKDVENLTSLRKAIVKLAS